MHIKFVYTLVYIILPSILIAHCAQLATGTAVKVVTVNQEDRSIGEFVDDTIIKTLIKNTYFDQNEKLFFNIDVEVSQGRVLLTGTIENIDLKIEATRIAWGVKGVQTVINEIQISNSDNIINFADDLIISTKVKGKLILNENVNSCLLSTIEYFLINKSPFTSPIVNFLILFFLQIFFKFFEYFMSSS